MAADAISVKVSITAIGNEQCPDALDQTSCRLVEVRGLTAPIKDKNFTIPYSTANTSDSSLGLRPGDTYYASYYPAGTESEEYLELNEIDRLPGLLILLLAFVLLIVLYGKKQGVLSLLALAINFGIVLFLFAQGILQGWPILPTLLVGGTAMLASSLFLSHGWQRKTIAAFLGSWLGFLFTMLLAALAIPLTRLTGFGSEETSFLIGQINNVPMTDILYAGIIIGILGAIDDVTVTQASSAFEIHKSDPKQTWQEIYKKVIVVGKDHIASLVNTLVVVYAGASFPLFLLLMNDAGSDFWSILNMEIIATEIVRMIIGSIGLMLSVPITSAIASYLATRPAKVTSLHSTRGK